MAEHGLPLFVVNRVACQVAPDDSGAAFRLVSCAPLASHRKAADNVDRARLSPNEAVKAARPAVVWTMAREVWGDDDEARAFAFRLRPMLDGRHPVDIALANELGHPIVEGIFGRLRYGAAA